MADAADSTPDYGIVRLRTLAFLDKLLTDFRGTLSPRQPTPALQTSQVHLPKLAPQQPQKRQSTKEARKRRQRPGRWSTEGRKHRPASDSGAYGASSQKDKQNEAGRREQGIQKKTLNIMDTASTLFGSLRLITHPNTWYCTLSMMGIG
ncbi:Hypothetical predicted protein [Pelobates cultripes]|uniref:Uncharacterized protein n=1 Tax=Pelobates cultripes TaxID=61616 RepID=A0AAD1W1R3_PELCU|nr:Hypothetical predicted protein [Pelobates cultripes]